MGDSQRIPTVGPFRAEQLKEGDRYELASGHAIYCAPAGGRHGGANATGALVLGSDPKVTEVGVDVGYSALPDELRAPDVSVGNVPNAPGWVAGVPPLAVEYADTGTNESDLKNKIEALHQHGTRWVWVVRLHGERLVQVHEAGASMRTARKGELLEAPGVLANSVPVEALFEREAALDTTLRNLLQRRGIPSLERALGDARQEGREEGREEGELRALRRTVTDLCDVLGIESTSERSAQIEASDRASIVALITTLKRDRAWPERE
jgi:Uma2 family endonuclease